MKLVSADPWKRGKLAPKVHAREKEEIIELTVGGLEKKEDII